MEMEAQNEFNETLSDTEKTKQRYGTLCEKIDRLEDYSYIDEDWFKVTLLAINSKKDLQSRNSKIPEEYRGISEEKLSNKKWIIVIKENMESWDCYITNVFYNPEYIWGKKSWNVIHKRWVISWIQKSKGGKAHGIKTVWDVNIHYDWEVAGFQESDNLDEKDISPILSKIYSRYLDILIPSQKQKNQDMKIMLDRVENNIKENNLDEFLNQSLENMA